MKSKSGFRLRKLGNEFIITAEGVEQINFNHIISLNKSAAFLWEKVAGRTFEVEDLARYLVEEYEGLSIERATADAKKLADDWIKTGIVEE